MHTLTEYSGTLLVIKIHASLNLKNTNIHVHCTSNIAYATSSIITYLCLYISNQSYMIVCKYW